MVGSRKADRSAARARHRRGDKADRRTSRPLNGRASSRGDLAVQPGWRLCHVQRTTADLRCPELAADDVLPRCLRGDDCAGHRRAGRSGQGTPGASARSLAGVSGCPAAAPGLPRPGRPGVTWRLQIPLRWGLRCGPPTQRAVRLARARSPPARADAVKCPERVQGGYSGTARAASAALLRATSGLRGSPSERLLEGGASAGG